jgi:hypothetical protein
MEISSAVRFGLGSEGTARGGDPTNHELSNQARANNDTNYFI